MEYKSANDLLAGLETRGLEIRDRALALHFLETVGYHRLSGFYPFFYETEKAFGIPTTVEDIFHLYSFDRRLRLLLVGPLEKIEVALRSQIIKEVGDYLGRGAENSITINLFDEDLYDLTTDQNKKNLRLAREGCENGARSHWNARFPGAVAADRSLTRARWEAGFAQHYRSLPAWTLLQSASFGPLTYIFATLKPEIAVAISEKFRLPRAVLNTTFFALKELRNSCAHHDPVWNWNARKRAVQLRFPKRYREPAGVDSENEAKLYPYCALLHILLSFLSNGQSTWHRRLKKLVNEYSTMYATSMGFPEHWQNMPFWCVSDVGLSENYLQLRDRISAQAKP